MDFRSSSLVVLADATHIIQMGCPLYHTDVTISKSDSYEEN